MRSLSIISLAIAAVLAACERSTDPTVAVVAGQPSIASSASLTITPSQVVIAAGSTAQLSTNASAGQQSQLQWSSSNTAVATVSGSGLVTGFSPGAATISARFSFDTTRVAVATVNVTP